MAKKPVLKREAVKSPATLEEAAEYLNEIRVEQDEIDRIKAKLNAQIDTLREKAMEATSPHEKSRSDLLEGLYVFAEARREEILVEDKKSVNLPTGTFGWRFTPPKVSIRDEEKVIEDIKKLKLNQFLRMKEEIDKQAMLKEKDLAETLKGVKIEQKEEFFAKPLEMQTEVSQDVTKLKKSIGM